MCLLVSSLQPFSFISSDCLVKPSTFQFCPTDSNCSLRMFFESIDTSHSHDSRCSGVDCHFNLSFNLTSLPGPCLDSSCLSSSSCSNRTDNCQSPVQEITFTLILHAYADLSFQQLLLRSIDSLFIFPAPTAQIPPRLSPIVRSFHFTAFWISIQFAEFSTFQIQFRTSTSDPLDYNCSAFLIAASPKYPI